MDTAMKTNCIPTCSLSTAAGLNSWTVHAAPTDVSNMAPCSFLERITDALPRHLYQVTYEKTQILKQIFKDASRHGSRKKRTKQGNGAEKKRKEDKSTCNTGRSKSHATQS